MRTDTMLLLLGLSCVGLVPSCKQSPSVGRPGRAVRTKIVFTRNGDIFSIDPDGRNETNITSTPDQREVGGRWSPDGSKLLFYYTGKKLDIWVMDADGSSPSNLTNTPDVQEEGACWSPDGSKIAFARGPSSERSIYTMDSGGTNELRLTAGHVDEAPCWSPDAQKIVFIRQMTPGRSVSHRQIFVVDADGRNVKQLTHGDLDDHAPSWSPDGAKILFQSMRDGKLWRDQVYVMNADGTDIVKLTDTQYRHHAPRWSPDGRGIVFGRSAYNSSVCDIWVMNADGGQARRLTNTPAISESGHDWGVVAPMR